MRKVQNDFKGSRWIDENGIYRIRPEDWTLDLPKGKLLYIGEQVFRRESVCRVKAHQSLLQWFS